MQCERSTRALTNLPPPPLPIPRPRAHAGGTTLTASQGGSQVWGMEVCATYFGNCNGGPPASGYLNVSIAMDALRV